MSSPNCDVILEQTTKKVQKIIQICNNNTAEGPKRVEFDPPQRRFCVQDDVRIPNHKIIFPLIGPQRFSQTPQGRNESGKIDFLSQKTRMDTDEDSPSAGAGKRQDIEDQERRCSSASATAREESIGDQI